MDFNDTPEEAAYRAQVAQWLAENAPKKGVPYASKDETALERSKAWQKRKADAGYAMITWPKEWGGGGGTSIQSVIYNQEQAKLNIAEGGEFSIGLGMCVPTVIAFADEPTKKRFVGPALSGEEIWCQLFSEPGGGSDAANARTRAVRDGDEWVINGQKVWTSGAHLSDYGIILTRTSPDKPKHKGLTMFWLDMKSPGVEVRPIHQMSGASGFNEVFFTDVRVKDSQRLGEVDAGWGTAIVTLMNERQSIGSRAGGDVFGPLIRLARSIRTEDGTLMQDTAFREKLAEWYASSRGLQNVNMRTLTAMSQGKTPGPENSIGKMLSAPQNQEMAAEVLRMMGEFGVISDPELAAAHGHYQQSLLGSPGGRIAGGTDEIMKNILAERVLGMPQDIRVDKDVAFKDIPAGA